jgi:hypothetical protein
MRASISDPFIEFSRAEPVLTSWGNAAIDELPTRARLRVSKTKTFFIKRLLL